MNQIRTGHFEADGGAHNLVLGFVPRYLKVTNVTAADTEVWELEWYREMGAAQEIWKYKLNNDGGDDIDSPVKKASGGYLTAYDTSVVGVRKSCTFDDTGGASADLITCTGHGYSNGEKVKFVEDGGLPTNLNDRTAYYVIDAAASTFRISATKGGSAVDFGSDGTPSNYVFSLDNLGEMAGGAGVTIAAAFMDDGDEIYYFAVAPDRDVDHGDIA